MKRAGDAVRAALQAVRLGEGAALVPALEGVVDAVYDWVEGRRDAGGGSLSVVTRGKDAAYQRANEMSVRELRVEIERRGKSTRGLHERREFVDLMWLLTSYPR